MAKHLTIALCIWLAFGHVHGQSAAESMPVKSRSGQFTASAHRTYNPLSQRRPIQAQIPMAGGWAYVIQPKFAPKPTGAAEELVPALLVISCERLKQAVLWELNLPDRWRGRVALYINGLLPENTEPLLTAVHAPDGWSYELELPASIKPQLLSRALINVILLEIANRNASDQSAQIPLWLLEGMTSHVQGESGTLLLQAKEQTFKTHSMVGWLKETRHQLRTRTPLSFQELSWPEESQITGKEAEFYRDCARLFVYELLRFKDGKECVYQLLQELPRHLNWQVAFLKAYSGHFGQLRDVEKWWGLSCCNLTSYDETTKWGPQESWQKLQAALDVPVRIHLASDRLPTEAALTLQEVIMQWEAEPQEAALRRTLNTLLSMRVHITPELAGVLNAYCVTLDSYLRKHPSGWLAWVQADKSSRRVKVATCRTLTTLDDQRASLRNTIDTAQRANNPGPGPLSARQ